ncbi:hypothetical protein [Wenzhouxiangella limi]|uniref:Uncharacterized protein n=1 Tax=Wenzhouxiangella limi TaxID=2707351 RepID=A0A845UYJ4_9GAMM|nr:hypothetical protein [Wenzhouxiangella limi]NDY95788.1 hypothetical protein [Wenzhouxiangella limi]
MVALTATDNLLAATTPHQTEGPFFPIHEQPDTDADITLIEDTASTRSARWSRSPGEC